MITASVKLTSEQMKILRNDARERRMSISDYLRATLFPEKTRMKSVYEKNPISGAIVDATPLDPISPEEVREALADFP